MNRLAKGTKYTYLFVVQGDYGHGWEDLTAAETMAEARGYLRDYRENDSYAKGLRMVKRRELNEETN